MTPSRPPYNEGTPELNSYQNNQLTLSVDGWLVILFLFYFYTTPLLLVDLHTRCI